MPNLRAKLIKAYAGGDFLNTLYENLSASSDERDALASELAAMHNEGLIDVVEAFGRLRNDPSKGPDFFLTRHIFEGALAELDAPVSAVMRCVLQLYREAGNDLAAGSIINGFVAFCERERNRPYQALREIEERPDDFADLLAATIAAGSRIDASHFLAQAIRLSESDNTELRGRAVFSFGIMHWPDEVALPESVFVALERSASRETDGQILAAVVRSAFTLLRRDKAREARTVGIITTALSRGDEITLHAASEFFGLHTAEVPPPLLDSLLTYLMQVNPANKGTLNYIDYGISYLLKGADAERAIRSLEDFLLKNPKNAALDLFDSAVREIRKSPALTSKVLTRWLLRGEPVLGKGVEAIVANRGGDEKQLAIDISELKPADPVHIIFLARKAIGYLFLQPVSATSILISLMHHTADKDVFEALGALLFQPLLLNFTRRVREYLVKQSELEGGDVKQAIDGALKAVDGYLDDLRSVGGLPALHPTQAQREAFHRHFSQQIAESYKAAEAQSPFLNLVSKSILLYGRKSIHYVCGPDGKPNRMEMALKSFGTEIEVPRLELVDPYGLDYLLRRLRAERLRA